MKPRSVVLFAVALAGVVFAVPIHAQPRGAGSTPEVLPAAPAGGGGTTTSGGASGPAADTPKTDKASGNLGGYAYDDKPKAGTKAAPHAKYRARTGPVVNMPGFEQTADGGTRLFVQLSQTVQVEERKAQGSITYVLKGASPRVHNNTNALVTVHFNTPVSRARLVPQGQDLHFIVELRAAATPTFKINETQDKTATLAIDFPKGNYLTAQTSTEVGPEARPQKKPGPRGKRNAPRPNTGNPPPAAEPEVMPPSDSSN